MGRTCTRPLPVQQQQPLLAQAPSPSRCLAKCWLELRQPWPRWIASCLIQLCRPRNLRLLYRQRSCVRHLRHTLKLRRAGAAVSSAALQVAVASPLRLPCPCRLR